MEFNYSSNWTVSLLDDITDRGSGHTPNQSEPSYWNGEIKWVSLADSKRLDNLFISTTEKEISELGIKNSSAVKHPAGTVILSRDAGVGKSAILKEEMAVSQHFIVWRCLPKNILNNVYFYYWLQMMKPEFERMAVGSTIKTIGLPYFKKLRITYPPLLEQRKIAEILGAWDDAIALLEKLITAKRKLKQGLMQQLLTGKKRFKEFEGEGNRWKTVTFNQIIDKCFDYRGRTPLKIEMEWGNGNIRALSASNVRMGKIDFDRECYFGSIELYKKWMTQGDVKKGDVLLTTEAPLGTVAQIPDDELYILSQRVILIRPKSHLLDKSFLFHLMTSKEFQDELDRNSSGSTAKGIQRKRLDKIVITIPSIQEQEKIASVLSAADTEISNLEQKLAAYKQQKRGLMQQLLTGKIRVKID